MSIQKEVADLQDDLANKSDKYYLEYAQIGYYEEVSLYIHDELLTVEIQLWNSENSDRIPNETFKEFLMRKINHSMKLLKELKEINK